MKLYLLTFIALLLGLVPLVQASQQVEYKQSSLQVEILESNWAYVGNSQSSASKKTSATTDIINQSFSVPVFKTTEAYFVSPVNHYYLPVHRLIHPKQFFLLI